MRDILFFLLSMFVLSSCENLLIKDLEIDDTQFEKQLVVQSFVEANTDSIVAFISENESVLTPTDEIKFLDNADVQLLYQGNEIAKLEQGQDGRYYHFFDTPITERGEYEVVVSHTPYADASASTILPEDRSIRDLKFKYDVGTDPLDMSTASEISFVIDDQPGKDYYTINLSTVSSGLDTFVYEPGDTSFYENKIYIYQASTQLDPSISTIGYEGDYVISDETFDGQSKTIKIRFILSHSDSSPGFEDEVREVLRLNFTTHSEDSFKYTTSLNAYYDSGDFGLFSEPVSVYTNIENGLGVFAGLSKKEYTFE
ncbi:DUF4249 domain-containing protein [Portibacter lacus]|uniref:DUF4249 domain-containing protein n=1 Tax=Portibacter lacus TaxID=1099794 RepID=A0AA37WDW0_9BACT|nr:DUF4249 domain-containing protein [Portibacter lacus]GLR15555.1 hypothetical protein GCM10007940_01700 [Portibacter lacus]